MYERIVVPLDGSDLAEQALPTAEELARAVGTTLHLIRVVDFPSSSFAYVYGSMMESQAVTMQLEDERTMAESYLVALARQIEEQGITVTTEVRHGVPTQELVDVMEQGDLFVMATHGRNGMARWFLGSVAEEITRRATVPVLLVRTKAIGSNHRQYASSTMTA